MNYLVIKKDTQEIQYILTEEVKETWDEEIKNEVESISDLIPIEEELDEFFKKYPYDITDGAHFYQDGEIVENIDLKQSIEKENLLQELRDRREQECFPVINRGDLWYKLLTEEQEAELLVWYQAWLNVTETLVIPEKPEWI